MEHDKADIKALERAEKMLTERLEIKIAYGDYAFLEQLEELRNRLVGLKLHIENGVNNERD